MLKGCTVDAFATESAIRAAIVTIQIVYSSMSLVLNLAFHLAKALTKLSKPEMKLVCA